MRFSLEIVVSRIKKNAIYVLALSTVFIVGYLSWETRTFVGDDLEVLNAIEGETYLNRWSDILTDTSLDKWRPVNNLYLFVTINLFGNSYPAFWVLNTGLMIALGMSIIFFFRTLGLGETLNQRLVISLAIVATLTSPFTFFSRQGIFGFLEIAPIILSIFAYWFFIRADTRNNILWSASLLAFAALIHERYLVLSFGFAIIGLYRARTDFRYRSSWRKYLFFPLFWLYTMIFALESNPLRGGGEQSFDESIGPWVIGRLLDVTLVLPGSSLGRTLYFDPEGLTSLVLSPDNYLGFSPRVWFGLLFLGLCFLWVCGVVGQRISSINTELSSAENTSRSFEGARVMEQLAIGLVLMLPAATVVSRLEMRWLFGSFTFAILAVSTWASLGARRNSRFVVLATFILGILSINTISVPNYSDFNFFRENTYSLKEYVERAINESTKDTLGIVVEQGQNANYIAWSTNNGKLFEPAENTEIVDVYFPRNAQEREVSIKRCLLRSSQCLEIRASSSTFNGTLHLTHTFLEQ